MQRHCDLVKNLDTVDYNEVVTQFGRTIPLTHFEFWAKNTFEVKLAIVF